MATEAAVAACFVTEAGRQRVPLAAVMALTDHRGVGIVLSYFHAGEVAQNPAAHLSDD